MYTYGHMHTPAHMSPHVCTHIQTHTASQMHVCTNTCARAHVCSNVGAHTHMYTCVCAHTCTFTHTQKYAHGHSHTQALMYTCTHVHTLNRRPTRRSSPGPGVRRSVNPAHICPIPGALLRQLWLKTMPSGSGGGDGGIHAGEGQVCPPCGPQSGLKSPHLSIPAYIITCVTGCQGTEPACDIEGSKCQRV